MSHALTSHFRTRQETFNSPKIRLSPSRSLADGNKLSEEGRRIGKETDAWGGRRVTDDFLEGERYLKSADAAKRFLGVIPMRDIPAQYVVVKPLDLADPEQEDIKSVTFFVDPERLSALVILANYTDPDLENVIVPWAAACQIMGIFAYRELEREHPRALIGLTDLSARLNVRASLGTNVLSFTTPWPLFLRMEQMGIMGREDVNQLPVMSDGQVEGIVSRAHVLQVLRSRAELKVPPSAPRAA